MKHIKKINEFFFFENDEMELKPDVKVLGKFNKAEFDEFCKTVDRWSLKNKKRVYWDLYAPSDSPGVGQYGGHGKDQARDYWDMNLKGDSTFNVVEKDGRLIGFILINGQSKSIFDHTDTKVSPSEIFINQ